MWDSTGTWLFLNYQRQKISTEIKIHFYTIFLSDTIHCFYKQITKWQNIWEIDKVKEITLKSLFSRHYAILLRMIKIPVPVIFWLIDMTSDLIET